MSLQQMPVGNAFSIVVALSIKDSTGTNPVTDLSTANGIRCVIGRDITAPDIDIDMTSGRITSDSPSLGSLTIALISSDTINLSTGEYRICVQVQYTADNENNVEWVDLPVFVLKKNNIPPV